MKEAIFLVTSLAGLRKTTFKNRVTMCLNEQAAVTVLLAMVRFNEFELAKNQLTKTFKPKTLDKLSVVSLADLVAGSKGVALAADETFDQSFLDLPKKTFEDSGDTNNVIDRYVDAGQIRGEVVLNAAGQTILMTRFVKNQERQTAVFQNNQMIGLLAYTDGQLTQSLLLNQDGEVAYRFLRHLRQVNWLYSFGRTSKLDLSVQMPTDDSKDERIVYQTSEQKPYYEVIDHVDYHRLGDLYAFYAEILKALKHPGTELFIDINDNQNLVSQMSKQLIFNY